MYVGAYSVHKSKARHGKTKGGGDVRPRSDPIYACMHANQRHRLSASQEVHRGGKGTQRINMVRRIVRSRGGVMMMLVC